MLKCNKSKDVQSKDCSLSFNASLDFSKSDFIPVIVGADIGVYALARSFHEEYNIPSIVVTTQVLGPISHSKIICVSLYDALTPLVSKLEQVALELKKKYSSKTLLLVANGDTYVREIVSNAQKLREYYTFAFPSLDLLNQTSDKRAFPKLAKQYGLCVPNTLEINVCNNPNEALSNIENLVKNSSGSASDFSYPLIVKTAMSAGYEKLHWPGKAKVYCARNSNELRSIISELHEYLTPHVSEYANIGEFVVQPRVEGNDTYNLSVTAYVDSNHNVKYLGSAHVILEDHVPTALGNPTIMLTERYPEIYEQVKAFLEGVSWFGFANFDFKVDARTNKPYCFEVNPRIGRNLYYNTAAGSNPMRYLVNDLVKHVSSETEYIKSRVCYSVLSYRLAVRYCDNNLKNKIKQLASKRAIFNPLDYSYEYDFTVRSFKRWLYVHLAHANYWRKFHCDYPYKKHVEELQKSLDTSFLCDE